MSARISVFGLRRLIWVDTLRRVHTVGFLVYIYNILADGEDPGEAETLHGLMSLHCTQM